MRPLRCLIGLHRWRCGEQFPEIVCEDCGATDFYEPL